MPAKPSPDGCAFCLPRAEKRGGYAAARGSRHVNPKWVRGFVVVIGVVMGTYTLCAAH